MSVSLRDVLRLLYRSSRLALPGQGSHRVLINSIPKAGTHLMLQWLDECTGLRFSGAHWYPRHLEARDASPVTLLRRRSRWVWRGQIATGHLHYDSSVSQCLQEDGFRVVNVIRDPRDLLVSHVHYVLKRREHYLHAHFAGLGGSFEDLLRASLRGFDLADGRFPSFRERLEPYVGWLEDPAILTFRFEELVAAQADGAALAVVLGRLLDHVGLGGDIETAVHKVRGARPERSRTFRKGVAGEWREHLSGDLWAEYRGEMGEVHRRLGYPIGDE